jgi:hypothetical protein
MKRSGREGYGRWGGSSNICLAEAEISIRVWLSGRELGVGRRHSEGGWSLLGKTLQERSMIWRT